MLTFEEARERILRRVAPGEVEEQELLECLGRVAGEDVVSTLMLPGCDNSAMDGFAVRAEDCAVGRPLRVISFLPAGESAAGLSVEAGEAIRIMTGAPIPLGADVVVPLEDTEFTESEVRPQVEVRQRQHIRFAGEDVRQGEVVVAQGTPLRAFEISLLASLGLAKVKVYRRPRVAILATGDEVVEIGETLREGQVYNSNSIGLAAAVRATGAEPVCIGIARDSRESLREKIAIGLQYDALITAAGVSMGDRDWVREVLAEVGVQEDFWRVAIKPGKASAFALFGNKPVFSLPGNPVSALLSFEELVRPALLHMMGHRRLIRPLLRAKVEGKLSKKPGRLLFARVNLRVRDGELMARSAGEQDTGRQKTLSRADAIAILEADRGVIQEGEEIRIHLLGGETALLEPGEN